MLAGRWVSAAIGTVGKFGIADHLESGPKSARDLAVLTRTNEGALYRLLRATASLGVFTELEDGRFDQTLSRRHCAPGRIPVCAIWR